MEYLSLISGCASGISKTLYVTKKAKEMEYINSFFKDSLSRVSIEGLKNRDYLLKLVNQDKDKINTLAIKEHLCELFEGMNDARVDLTKLYMSNSKINTYKKNMESAVVNKLRSTHLNRMDDIVTVLNEYHSSFNHYVNEIPPSGNTSAMLSYTLAFPDVEPSMVLFYHELINAELQPEEAESLLQGMLVNNILKRKNYNSIRSYPKPKMLIQMLYTLHKFNQLKQANFDALINNLQIGATESFEMKNY